MRYFLRLSRRWVSSAIERLPPITRFDIGQETNSCTRSTSTTWMSGSPLAMYLAHVAPPNPAPMMRTRGVTSLPKEAQPAKAAAPAPMKSRRLTMAACKQFAGHSSIAGKPRVLLGDGRRLFLEGELDLFVLADVDRHLAAML